MSETDIKRQIQLLSRGNVRLWRNNNGRLEDKFGNYVHYGLATYSHDLIGILSMVITKEMVGERIAQFVSIECKAPGAYTEPKRLQGQRDWMNMVKKLGGRSGFAYSLEDAKEILEL